MNQATPIVDKVAWTPIRGRRILFARSRGQELFYCAGGNREPGESDCEALIRETLEETKVRLLPETIEHVVTLEGPAHNRPPGTILKMACYRAEGDREPLPAAEVEELAWFTSADGHRTTEMGRIILDWFREHDLID